MHLDLHVPRFEWAGSPAAIGPGVADLAQRAEAIGVRTLSFMDHYFQMDWMAPAEDPMLEGYTALGFVAGHTSRLRLRLLVTGVTYRYPGLLAKMVTTLDVLSGGRAELGIGAAWYEREHRGLGVPFPPTPDDVVRSAEEFAKLGVSTVVTSTPAEDPARSLESTFGPAMDRLAELQPAGL